MFIRRKLIRSNISFQLRYIGALNIETQHVTLSRHYKLLNVYIKVNLIMYILN